MAQGTERASAVRMASVLVPVVVGGLLGLATSTATKVVDARIERAGIERKEHAAHRERAMTLTTRYLGELGKLLSIGILRNGDIKPDDLAVMSAPTDTLTELSVVISLYFPKWQGDLEQIHAAHQAMMLRYDDVIDARGKRPAEDAAAYEQRIREALAPSADRVRTLMRKIAEMKHPDGT